MTHSSRLLLCLLASLTLSACNTGLRVSSSPATPGAPTTTPQARYPVTVAPADAVIPPSKAARPTSLRWKAQGDRTLRVHIGDADTLETWTEADRESVLEALRTWEATGIPIRFKIVGPDERADVTITWVDRFKAYYSGWTTLHWDSGGWIHNATIQLALRAPHGALLNTATRNAVAVHEIGHVLGLPHATSRDAIMWAVANEMSRLTDMDTEAVRKLYKGDS